MVVGHVGFLYFGTATLIPQLRNEIEIRGRITNKKMRVQGN